MKKVLGILLLAMFLFTACNDDSSLLEPSYESVDTSLEKGRIIFDRGADDSQLSDPTDGTDEGDSTKGGKKSNNEGE